MVKPEAFLAIEETLSKILVKAFKSATKKILEAVDSAASESKWDDVEAQLGSLSLVDMHEGLVPALTYQTNVAMLFGASQVTSGVGTSVVGLGFEKITTDQIVQGFRSTLMRMETTLRDQCLQLIAQKKEQEKEVAVVQKDDTVLREFSSFVNEKGEAYLNIVASLHTSRVSAYGFTAEAHVLGLVEYQINEQLDTHICPVCRHMHGKTFKVADARNLLNVVTRTTDPEDLKSLQPWPKQDKESLKEFMALSDAELVSRGWHIPPYHPLCRGLLGRKGTVRDLGGQPQSDGKYTATDLDFTSLGLKCTKKTLAKWNKELHVPPSSVLSTLTGVGEPELLADTILKGNLKDSIGLQALTQGKTTKVSLVGPCYGAEVTQVVSFNPETKNIAVSSLQIGEDPTVESTYNYLKAVYRLTKDIEYNSVSVSVVGSGVSWLEKGFYPSTAKDWEAMKKTVYSRYLSGEHTDASEVLDALSASENPLDAVKLLGIPQGTLVELLEGLAWSGSLTVDNKEQVQKFLSTATSE